MSTCVSESYCLIGLSESAGGTCQPAGTPPGVSLLATVAGTWPQASWVPVVSGLACPMGLSQPFGPAACLLSLPSADVHVFLVHWWRVCVVVVRYTYHRCVPDPMQSVWLPACAMRRRTSAAGTSAAGLHSSSTLQPVNSRPVLQQVLINCRQAHPSEEHPVCRRPLAADHTGHLHSPEANTAVFNTREKHMGIHCAVESTQAAPSLPACGQ